MTDLRTDRPGDFNAVKLVAPTDLQLGDIVFYVFNLGTHWETRGPVKIAAVHDDGYRVSMEGQPHGWFDPKHVFRERHHAAIAADQLTHELKRQ